MSRNVALIGVFDSGVGGLTVLRALRAELPFEDFIYLGDTARLPYGTKSAESVVRYSLQCAEALMARGIRCLVVACNTASASALDALRRRYPETPVIGVIEPGAAAAVAASASQNIAVIATEGTIAGGAYQAAIRRLSPRATVVGRSCSLFVAMAEEGWVDGVIAEDVAHRYLQPIFGNSLRGGERVAATVDAAAAVAAATTVAAAAIPDTLVLGCTHFPVLAGAIRAVLPPHVHIVDSAATTAAAVALQLSVAAGVVTPGASASADAGVGASVTVQAESANYDSERRRHGVVVAAGQGAELGVVPRPGRVTWLATDGAARFARVSTTFLGSPLRADDIEIIDL